MRKIKLVSQTEETFPSGMVRTETEVYPVELNYWVVGIISKRVIAAFETRESAESYIASMGNGAQTFFKLIGKPEVDTPLEGM